MHIYLVKILLFIFLALLCEGLRAYLVIIWVQLLQGLLKVKVLDVLILLDSPALTKALAGNA